MQIEVMFNGRESVKRFAELIAEFVALGVQFTSKVDGGKGVITFTGGH